MIKQWLSFVPAAVFFAMTTPQILHGQSIEQHIVWMMMPYQNLNGEYRIDYVWMDGKPYDVSDRQYPVTITEKDGSISGRVCNNFRSSFSTTMGGTAQVGAILSTKKICVAMADEEAIFGALANVNAFSLDGHVLQLLQDETVLLQLIRKAEKKAPVETLADAAGKQWRFTWLLHNGERIDVADRGATLQYDMEQNRMSGRGFCNRYFGTMHADNINATSGRMQTGPLGSTMMACPEEGMNESILFSLLQKADGYQFIGNEWQLTFHGEPVLGAVLM